ncbi:MAG TPA: CBS domain-containing protein [Candidatus Limnocylindria bacterium]
MTATQFELSAGDLMTIEPVMVAVDVPIEEAERLILDHGISGLPVVDQGGALVGVVSQTDFMHLANPDVRNLIHHKASGIRIGEVMSRPPVTVLLSTPLVEAARKMVDERVHRVVVVDDGQRPLGVLSAMDFVTLFAEG